MQSISEGAVNGVRRLTRVVASFAAVAVVLGVLAAPSHAGEQDCLSYAYDCTPGYTADNTQGTWAWSHYGDIPGNDITDLNGRNHNCTLYAAWRLQQSGMGDPGNWGNAADWAGRIGGGNHSPAVGSIAWWGTERGGGFGHVAYVEQVSGGNVYIRADNYSTRYGYTDAGWIAASSVDLFLHPHDVAAGGRQPDGTLIRTPDGGIFRVVGGAPLHLNSCDPFNGCAGYVSVPDLSAYLPTPADGATLTAVDTGRVYKFVGGAPVWLATCAGGCGSPWGVNQWTVDVGDHMNPVPADGATMAAADTGRVYKIVGGAPLWLASCDAGCGNPVGVDQATIDRSDHLRLVPADGATLATQDTGRVYKVAGGDPLWLHSCSADCGNPVQVNQWTVDVRDHMSPTIADGTFVRVADGDWAGLVGRAAGGALLGLGTCDPLGGCPAPVNVNQSTYQEYGSDHPNPVDGAVVAGLPSGRLVRYDGGCAVAVSDGSALTAVDDTAFDLLPRCLALTTVAVPNAVWKIPYSTTLTASGGNGPSTWSVASGTLPPGLTMSSAGVVSGRPTAAGVFRFVAQVTDEATPVHSATKALTLRVAALGVATSSVPAGVVGKPYSTSLTAQSGVGTKSWAVTSGALPAGMTLSAAGRLTGTPTAAGTFRFAVTVTDSAAPADTATRPLQIVVAPIAVRTTSLNSGTVGTAYSQTLLAWGGTAPLRWKLVSGALPPGVTLSAAGVLSGRPTTAGSFEVTVRVLDAQRKAASATLALAVS